MNFYSVRPSSVRVCYVFDISYIFNVYFVYILYKTFKPPFSLVMMDVTNGFFFFLTVPIYLIQKIFY